MTPLLSVLLPVFNGSKYLEAAVQSILGQSFTDFEFIIIDDGSTDGTLELLQRFGQDQRVVLVSRENRGLVETLNEGIRMARGQWIARMDADDIALPHRFARQLQWIEHTDADICGSWAQFFGTRDRRVLRHPQSDQAIKMGLMFGTMFAHPTVLIKTTLARQLMYDGRWEKCEDYDLWERAARLNCRMANVPEVLLMYRQHPHQISSRDFLRQQQFTQRIRHRYGEFVFDSLGLRRELVEEVLKIREMAMPVIDMQMVDSAFTALLQSSQGEARAVILDHMTRLYYRVAAQSPGICARWHRLNARFGSTSAVDVRVKLWLLRLLRVQPGGRWFERTKALFLGAGRG